MMGGGYQEMTQGTPWQRWQPDQFAPSPYYQGGMYQMPAWRQGNPKGGPAAFGNVSGYQPFTGQAIPGSTGNAKGQPNWWGMPPQVAAGTPEFTQALNQAVPQQPARVDYPDKPPVPAQKLYPDASQKVDPTMPGGSMLTPAPGPVGQNVNILGGYRGLGFRDPRGPQ